MYNCTRGLRTPPALNQNILYNKQIVVMHFRYS